MHAWVCVCAWRLCAQVVEFDAPGEVVTCVAYHPFHHEVAAGFLNGRVRVFDVATTTLVQVRGPARFAWGWPCVHACSSCTRAQRPVILQRAVPQSLHRDCLCSRPRPKSLLDVIWVLVVLASASPQTPTATLMQWHQVMIGNHLGQKNTAGAHELRHVMGDV